MKRLIIGIIAMSCLMTYGCATTTPDKMRELVFDKIYYVVFEGKPKIVNDKVWYGETMEIGKILDQKPSNDLFVATISIYYKHNDLMKDNVVFYVSGDKLTYETVAETGKPLEEGAKILGFTGKTSLWMFKTKSAIKNFSDAAMTKAQELYNKAIK